MLRGLPLAFLAAIALLAGGQRAAHAQVQPTAKWHVDSEHQYVDEPFAIDLVIDGFDASSVPMVPPPKIEGATVTPMPVGQPMLSRRTRMALWTIKFKVEAHKSGRLEVPVGHALQGSRSAVAPAGGIDVEAIPTATDQKLQLVLPDRPVYVGETIDAQLVWLFREQPAGQTFKVPLMASDDVIASAPPAVPMPNGKVQAIAFSAGGKDIPVPFTADVADVDGRQYNRVTFAITIAPRKAGKLEVPATSVIASMPYGDKDWFGNPTETRPVRVTDVARTLDVRALPETDKPASFAGAVGEKFSIAVTANRSVVQLGEPVDLQIVVKNDQRLDQFALGDLAGEGGLPKDKFSVPSEAPTGELSEDGKTKTFAVTAQVTGPATEIPALALAYFDPRAGAYKTVRSEPIALSVKGGSIVGADSVVSGVIKKPVPGATAAAGANLDTGATVGAQLALSTAGIGDTPLGGPLLWVMVALLYLVPVGVFGVRTWQLRTKMSRAESAGVRAARKRLDDALDAAAKQPARAAVGTLVGALRDYTRAIGASGGRELDDLIGTLETEAFAPEAADRPIGAARIAEVRAAAERWLAKRPASGGGVPKAVALVVIVLAALGHPAEAAGTTGATTAGARTTIAAAGATAGAAATIAAAGATTGATTGATDTEALATGRAAYGEALDANDASAKRAAFARAAVALRQVATAHPSADLLADWGNAALGAGDVGAATLAYRRALALDAGNARARQNLELLRGRVPEMMKPTDGGAADSLLFFHRWTRAKKLVVGGAAFALAVLMLVPWRGRRRRGLVNLAILPGLVWIAMLVSAIAENRHASDAVVMDDSVLRAADSTGAPAAIPQVLARGTEVTVLEKREGWTRVQIANGKDGWLQTGTIEMVVL